MKRMALPLGIFVAVSVFVAPIWAYNQNWGFRPMVTVMAIFAVLGILRGLKLI